MNNIYAITELSPKKIHCGDELNIMLKLTGVPHLINNPADIVIMIDRSGSMNNSSMEYMKTAIKKFIKLIDKATDKEMNGIIGFGSRIGILSFSSSATINCNLTSDVKKLNNFENTITASGKTNHYDAFSLALKMLKNSENQKIIILFTDSRSNMGGDATLLATKAKENGIDIYCVGLTGLYGIDINTLTKWSSLPNDDYLAITPNPEELHQIFEKIAHKIINNSAPVATNISIYQKLSENFTEPYNITVSKGNIKRNNDGSFIWEIDTLAKDKMEEIIMKYTTTNTGTTTGTEEPIKTANYVDNENNAVTISKPASGVYCPTPPMVVEECPTSVGIDFDNCSDAMEFDAGEVEMQSMGRIMQIDVTVPNVCPNRRVALAVVLNELDEDGNEYKRGLKTFTIPAHNNSTCQDIMVKCIKFVLPEDLNEMSDSTSLCSQRSFNTKLIAHYIDTDYECCPDDDDSALTSSN